MGKDGHIHAEVKLTQPGCKQRLACKSYCDTARIHTKAHSLTHTYKLTWPGCTQRLACNSYSQYTHKGSLSLSHTNSHDQDAHKDSHTHKQIVQPVYTPRQTHIHT